MFLYTLFEGRSLVEIQMLFGESTLGEDPPANNPELVPWQPDRQVINRPKQTHDRTYLIFVTNISNESCGEKIVMWRNFRFQCVMNVEKS